jgi:hypothetical protein
MTISTQVRLHIFVALLVVTNLATSHAQAQPEPDRIHMAGKLLIENERFAAYRHRPYYSTSGNHESIFCSSIFMDEANRESKISLVFKANHDTVITNDEEYRRRFEEEIFPVLKEQCQNVKRIYIYNYVHGVRIYHQLNGKNYDSAVLTYDQQPPQGSSESSLNYVLVNLESGKFSYEVRNDGASPYDSLGTRRDIATSISYVREIQALRESARIEQKQSAVKNRIEGNLAKAAEVFKFYKKGAPPTYDFSGYANQPLFQNIYAGKFEPFTGGFESREAWVSGNIRSGFGNADARNPFGFLLNLLDTTADAADIRARRDALDGVFYAYHLAYKEQCALNTEMPWDVSALTFYLTRNGVRVEDSEVEGNVHLVRKPFLKTFNGSYGNLGNTANVTPPIPDALTNDFRKFLKTEGCSSAAVRYFETNLYLATEWMPPLQQLQEFIRVEQPKPVVEQPKAQTEAQKTKPQNEKVRPRPRRRRP